MTKIEKMLELLNGDPTLWEVYSFQNPWTVEELNKLSVNEAILKIPALALEMQRPEAALVAKYFEIRSDLDSQLVLDVQIMPSTGMTWQEFTNMPYTLDDLIKNVTIIQAKVGDYVRVNIRTIAAFDPQIPIATFHGSNGAIQGHHGSANKTDPNYWGFATAHIIATGYANIGTMITGLKRSVMFVVDE